MINSNVNTNINTPNSRAAAANKPSSRELVEGVRRKFKLPSIEAIKDNPAALKVLNSLLVKTQAMAEGGVVPRKTEIAGQPHALAYINPEEEQMLLDAGGSGEPGPGGIPAYAINANDGQGKTKQFSTVALRDAYLAANPSWSSGTYGAGMGTGTGNAFADNSTNTYVEAIANEEAEKYAADTIQPGAAADAQKETTRLNLKLSELKARDNPAVGEEGHNPNLQRLIDATDEELKGATKKAADIGLVEQSEIIAGQRKLIKTATTDPTALVTKTEVAGITDAPIDPETGLPKVETEAEKTARLAKLEVAAGTGQVAGDVPATTTTKGTASTADAPSDITASNVTASTATDAVTEANKLVTSATGTVSDESQTETIQGTLSEGSLPDANKFGEEYTKEVVAGKRKVSSDELAVAQGLDEQAIKTKIAQANVPDNIKAAQTSVSPEEIPNAAQIAESDMAQAEAITSDGLSEDATAVAKKMESFNVDEGTLAEFKEGKIEAQDTVQGQLASLMAQFDDGTPAWAAGAMRAANAAMASRGMGGSSMAAGAIVQAAMESAIPIASSDANAFREMKLNNLGRQQQISLANAAAQQGVKLQNFTAEQQTALQNSQNSFSLQSQNLSNQQSVVLANAQIKASLQGQNLSNQQQANLVEAARYAEVNNLNLNNRQQGILQDNANELQVNLANLSSKQQAYLANAQLEAALQGKKIDNKQQVAMQKAAAFSSAANITFNAAEQSKLHNSDLMKTIGLANLSSAQATTLQNAAQIASMDMANLSAAQQAAVQNANAFLQMDMANLSNEQQATMFKSQSLQQSILTDTAAENAAKQFNASSDNQTKQFMANLNSQVTQFNATQNNAMSQFNAGEANALSKFDASLKEQRSQFNATNGLAVAQANATWRQNIETLDASAQNAANMQDATNANNFTKAVMDQIWMRERDLMDFAFKSSEGDKQIAMNILLKDKTNADYQAAREDKDTTYRWAVYADYLFN